MFSNHNDSPTCSSFMFLPSEDIQGRQQQVLSVVLKLESSSSALQVLLQAGMTTSTTSGPGWSHNSELDQGGMLCQQH